VLRDKAIKPLLVGVVRLTKRYERNCIVPLKPSDLPRKAQQRKNLLSLITQLAPKEVRLVVQVM
jgi:hypothetical protein